MCQSEKEEEEEGGGGIYDAQDAGKGLHATSCYKSRSWGAEHRARGACPLPNLSSTAGHAVTETVLVKATIFCCFKYGAKSRR